MGLNIAFTVIYYFLYSIFLCCPIKIPENNRGRGRRDASQRLENPITVGKLESSLGIFSNYYAQICEFYSLGI